MSKLVVFGLLFSILLAACGGAATPPSDQTTALEARIATLESRIAELESASTVATPAAGEADANQGFAVVVAQFLTGNAGFHEMSEVMTDTQTVDPAYLGVVNQMRKIVAQTPWPAELQPQADDFHETLEEFAAALEADNGQEAAVLASAVHDAQHELSTSIDAWLGEAEAGEHDD